jgi:hypothetical protein
MRIADPDPRPATLQVNLHFYVNKPSKLCRIFSKIELLFERVQEYNTSKLTKISGTGMVNSLLF